MSSLDVKLESRKISEVYDVLVKGIKEYTGRHDFTRVVLGLSGGIDSAIVCCLASQAMGAENVLGISLPSVYSSKDSAEYAKKLADNLGVKYDLISISDIYKVYVNALGEKLAVHKDEDVEVYMQNIQARIRGNILMAFSNRFGYLVLATGNKSEALMGYCTLYGDTVGGLAPLSNILKTTVYQLAEYINKEKELIPKFIIDRHPTAELKPGQKDQDSLPPYDVLDGILFHLSNGSSEDEIVKKGFSRDIIKEVVDTIERTAYKRKQCPPGIEVNVY